MFGSINSGDQDFFGFLYAVPKIAFGKLKKKQIQSLLCDIRSVSSKVDLECRPCVPSSKLNLREVKTIVQVWIILI